MDSLWDRVKKNLVEWYGTAYDKTDELARIGKKKVEIIGINRAIEKHLSELGGRVYDLIVVKKKAGEVAIDPEVAKLVDGIGKLEDDLQLKEKEIESIRKEEKHDNQAEEKEEE